MEYLLQCWQHVALLNHPSIQKNRWKAYTELIIVFFTDKKNIIEHALFSPNCCISFQLWTKLICLGNKIEYKQYEQKQYFFEFNYLRMICKIPHVVCLNAETYSKTPMTVWDRLANLKHCSSMSPNSIQSHALETITSRCVVSLDYSDCVGIHVYLIYLFKLNMSWWEIWSSFVPVMLDGFNKFKIYPVRSSKQNWYPLIQFYFHDTVGSFGRSVYTGPSEHRLCPAGAVTVQLSVAFVGQTLPVGCE